ncbi:mechanosensitive ion channel [Aliiglaciecola sp. CAU 1673]|uniref:mechanosensitive ion channel family protein n=1 Tax=Aliiglaciecola sp. CAU 1673 TaxID=3032595 RepID=UPI0023DC7C4D|nr:mechanosensitive ion channel [Aliiglaciecola sp. CAU 1673]MDF2177251.1 mechanosensitive ion channel [Aliiglaciecola sp. CAU 1673]
MQSTTATDWQAAITTIYNQVIDYLLAFVPQLLGALLLILLGWLVAWLFSKLTLSFLQLINRLLTLLPPALLREKRLEIQASHGRVASKIIFWMVMLFFLAAAASFLGLVFFANWLSAFLGYLPSLLSGFLIILGGYLLGNLLSTMARAGAESAGLPNPLWVGTAVRFAIVFTALLIGVEQLGINIQFITNLVIVLTAVFCFGLALAFGLGSRDFIANVIGARQAHKHCRLREHLVIGDIEGMLVEITDTMLVLETRDGRTLMPAKHYLDRSSTVRNQGAQPNNSEASS